MLNNNLNNIYICIDPGLNFMGISIIKKNKLYKIKLLEWILIVNKKKEEAINKIKKIISNINNIINKYNKNNIKIICEDIMPSNAKLNKFSTNIMGIIKGIIISTLILNNHISAPNIKNNNTSMNFINAKAAKKQILGRGDINTKDYKNIQLSKVMEIFSLKDKNKIELNYKITHHIIDSIIVGMYYIYCETNTILINENLIP